MSATNVLQGQNFQNASHWQTSGNQHFNQKNNHSAKHVNAIAVLFFAACCAGIAAVVFYPHRDSDGAAVYGQQGLGAFTFSLLAAAFNAQRGQQKQAVQNLFKKTLVPQTPVDISGLVVTRGKRDACSSPPETVAIGSPLTLAISSFTSHSIAQGTDGRFLQVWTTSTGVAWRLISASYSAGGVTSQNFITGGTPSGQQAQVVALSSGGYQIIATYLPGNNDCQGLGVSCFFIDTWVLNSSGVLSSSSTTTSYTANSGDMISSSISPLSNGYTGLMHSYSAGLDATDADTIDYRIFSGVTSGAGVSVDSADAAATLVATDGAASGAAFVGLWSYSGTLYGSVFSGASGTGGSTVTAKTTLASVSPSALACAYISNGNIVAVWINSATGKAEFKILSGSLAAVTGIIEVDACTAGAQSQPAVKKLRDGFYITLISNGQLLGYYFGSTGTIVNGKTVLNSDVSGTESNPVITSLSTSQLYIASVLNGGTLLSRPFQINSAPSIANPIPNPQIANATVPYSLTLSGVLQDPDVVWGDSLTYNVTGLPSWASFNLALLQITGTPLKSNRGTSNVTFSAVDLLGASGSDPFQLVVPNIPPYANGTISSQQVFVGSPWSLSVEQDFADPEGDSLTYSATSGPYAFSNGTFSWTPRSGSQGTYPITISVNDGYGGFASTGFNLTVPNRPPVLVNPIPSQGVLLGSLFSLTVPNGTFVDPDGDSITYGATLSSGQSLPSWLKFFSNGTFFGSPQLGNQGLYPILLSAFDPYGGVGMQNFTLNAFNNPPTVNITIPAQMVHLGNLFLYAIPNGTFVDPQGRPLSYSATLAGDGALPTWLQFNVTGTFFGTPTTGDEGVYTIQLTATDPYDASASETFTLDAYDNPPVVTTPTPSQNATLTVPFNYILPTDTFTDPDGDPITLTAGGLPSWLTFNPTTGAFSGTPPISGGIGSSPIQVNATDPFAKSATESFDIQVSSPPPTIIYLPSHLQATPNSAFFFPVTTVFEQITGFSLTYSVSGLPGWVTLQNNILIGTPLSTDIGSTTITITATDQFGAESSAQVPLVVSSGGTNSLAIGNPILDISEPAGMPFTYVIPSNAFVDAPGNTISLLSSLGDGSPLPSWLSFDGNRTYIGHPQLSNVGVYNLLMRAFDQLGATAIQTFSITINSPDNLPPAIIAPPSDLVAFTTQLFNQYVGGVFAPPVNLSAQFEPNTWLSLQGQYLTGTPGYTDSGVLVTLNGTNAAGATSSVNFKVTLQGQTAGTLAVSIIFPTLGAIGFLLTVYRYREWIKEKTLSSYNWSKRRSTAGLEIGSQAEFSMNPLDSAITLEAFVGAPFYKRIDLEQNPLLKDAEKYEVVGETRLVGGKTTNRLPEWVTGANVNMNDKTVILKGTPTEASLRLNKVNIVAYHGGEPSYYKVFIDVKHFEDSGRRSIAPVERDEDMV